MARIWLALLTVPWLTACATLGYYGQLARGQMELLSRREPIATLLAQPDLDVRLRGRLALAREARRFASTTLQLPDNASYLSYADLGRPFVVWNLFATPELSLDGKEWCYPLVGCLAYRGYFRLERARHEAQSLRAQGLDTHIGGVAAYSTLGWMDDPLLSSMLQWDDDELIDTIFHELAHQQLYIDDDTTFNESFASFVGSEGLRAFRAARSEPPPDPQANRREEEFLELMFAARARLEALYASGAPAAQLRTEKAAEFARLRTDYWRLRTRWNGDARYDAWFAGELNNARLLPLGLYRRWVPAFAALFARSGSDWSRFYAAAQELGGLPAEERERRLAALQAGS